MKRLRYVKLYSIFMVLVAFMLFSCNNKSEDVKKFSISFEVEGGNGDIVASVDGNNITSPNMVEKGKKITFTAVPDTDFTVKKWIGAREDEDNKLKAFLRVMMDSTVKVEFARIFAVNFDVDGEGGTIVATYNGKAFSSGAKYRRR